MVPLSELLVFGAAALLMVVTPGPNMIYLLSRSICQGKRAGVVSLFGVIAGFLVHMLAAAIGLTAIVAAMPRAYEVLRLVGAAYLLHLAWQAVRPKGRSLFEVRDLPADSKGRLFVMGLMTNVLNPKIAIFHLAILPQFVSPEHGQVFLQGIQLGTMQILISFAVNLCIVLSAAKLASLFSRSPRWLAAQRYAMGTVLSGLAVRLVTEQNRAA